MENLEFQNQTKTLSNTFVANVFMWMFVALGITAITAYLFGTNAELISMMLSQKSDGSVGISLFGWIVMLAPLIIVFIMSARIEKMKACITPVNQSK